MERPHETACLRRLLGARDPGLLDSCRGLAGDTSVGTRSAALGRNVPQH